MSFNPARYGIYYTPPKESDLWQKACVWLGRDAESGALLSQPDLTGLVGYDIANATQAPRHYGFHATLKPPFHLHEGQTEDRLHQALHTFSQNSKPFDISPLSVRTIGSFIALQPTSDTTQLDCLAADCVRKFDAFRAPPSEAELNRRSTKGLSERQQALLLEWGYPYVMDEFRFHMTLTGALPASVRHLFDKALCDYFQDCSTHPLIIEGLALFKQPDPNTPFIVQQRYLFDN